MTQWCLLIGSGEHRRNSRSKRRWLKLFKLLIFLIKKILFLIHYCMFNIIKRFHLVSRTVSILWPIRGSATQKETKKDKQKSEVYLLNQKGRSPYARTTNSKFLGYSVLKLTIHHNLTILLLIVL